MCQTTTITIVRQKVLYATFFTPIFFTPKILFYGKKALLRQKTAFTPIFSMTKMFFLNLA